MVFSSSVFFIDMDISPNSLVALRPGYMFLIPQKKHPDKLIQDYLHSTGEFSPYADMGFERHRKWMREHKARQCA